VGAAKITASINEFLLQRIDSSTQGVIVELKSYSDTLEPLLAKVLETVAEGRFSSSRFGDLHRKLKLELENTEKMTQPSSRAVYEVRSLRIVRLPSERLFNAIVLCGVHVRLCGVVDILCDGVSSLDEHRVRATD